MNMALVADMALNLQHSLTHQTNNFPFILLIVILLFSLSYLSPLLVK